MALHGTARFTGLTCTGQQRSTYVVALSGDSDLRAA